MGSGSSRDPSSDAGREPVCQDDQEAGPCCVFSKQLSAPDGVNNEQGSVLLM